MSRTWPHWKFCPNSHGMSIHETVAPLYKSLSGSSMGTSWTVKLRDSGIDLARLNSDIQAALDEIVAQMSTWDPASAISRLNQSETGWYQVPSALFHVLSHALELAEASSGAYDPTVGQLVNLWGFGPSGPVDTPPPDHAIRLALTHTGWQRTALDHRYRAVWQPGGMHFDLSSIAKGFGADEVSRVLDAAGITDYLVELGGEVTARGAGPAGTHWALNIETPALAEQIPIVLKNISVATSGDYRRFFMYQGHRMAHTINARCGTPVAHPLASVTVLHPQCMMADGLATALLAMGPEKGFAHARHSKVAALFMTRHSTDFAVSWTDEFAALAGMNRTASC